MNNCKSELLVRRATPEDATAILEVYAPYVKKTAITFEYEVPSLEEYVNRIIKISSRYPFLVAEEQDVIVGYAYASTFKERTAYDWSVETSIYIDQTKKSKGLGKKLYHTLEQILKEQNVTNLCACISYPNPESISFHKALGYKEVAHFHKCGYKFNTWYDMIWMEKFINPHSHVPDSFIPVNQIPENSGGGL